MIYYTILYSIQFSIICHLNVYIYVFLLANAIDMLRWN